MSNAQIDYESIAINLGAVFKPATPIDDAALFCGRTTLIRSAVDVINQAGQHAILYGEPGVGKTSLAKILATRITTRGQAAPIISPHVNCDSGDTYDSIWRKVFSEIGTKRETGPAGFQREIKIESGSVSDEIKPPIGPDTVRRVLTEIGYGTLTYVILDEFDKIPSKDIRKLMADTIKVLSDRSVPATVMIVGVSDDVHGLIEDHQSVERCLSQIHMPRMSRNELQEIIKNGFSKMQMTIDDDAIWEISELSKGLPHYTHLLSLHAGRQALDTKSLAVDSRHVQGAIRAAISQCQESTRNNYDKAILTQKKHTLHRNVLLACSMAQSDDFGNFSPNDVAEALSRITKEKYRTDRFAKHLHAFADSSRGPVLKKTGSEYRWRYRFVNPLMQPFVIMKGLEEGTINQADLRPKFDATGQGHLGFQK